MTIAERTIFPDISFYQDDDTTPQGIDFVKMREKTEFVIIRAGQNTWIDSDFVENWENAKSAGLARGSYWYYDSRNAPKKQAELWYSALGDDLGEMPLWADYEERYGGNYGGWRNFKVFLEHLKELMPEKEIGIYTGYYYWRENTPQSSPTELEYFSQYPVWLARYDIREPIVPKPFADWLFWQYTATGDGELYGVESKGIDLNYFNGTVEEMRERFKITEQPTNPPAGEDEMIADAILELAKQTGRIADALENGVVAPPPVDQPSVEKMWKLVKPRPNGHVPFYRNNDVNDSKLIVWSTNIVVEGVPPKRYWDSEAQLANIMRYFAWIPSCVTVNAGGKSFMMPEEFTTTSGRPCNNWYGGAFVKRENLEKA